MKNINNSDVDVTFSVGCTTICTNKLINFFLIRRFKKQINLGIYLLSV